MYYILTRIIPKTNIDIFAEASWKSYAHNKSGLLFNFIICEEWKVCLSAAARNTG